MLQVPTHNALSLPPSQTPTLVGRTSLSPSMAAEESQSASDVRWIQETEHPNPTSTANPTNSEQQSIPKVSLTFLPLSGKRKAWEFEQTDSFAVVKDRIFNEWPSEWADETKPQSAGAIRLLHLGRLLPDEESLSNNPRFPPRPAPSSVVHLSVRPYPARGASTTGSLKQRTSLLRTGNAFSFSGRGNTTNANNAANAANGNGTNLASTRPHGSTEPGSQPVDSSRERHSSGCGCIIC